MKRVAVLAVAGTALYASWPFAAFYTESLMPYGSFDPWVRNAAWTIALLFLLVGFACSVIFGRRLDEAYFQKRCQLAAGASFAVGNGCIVCADLLQSQGSPLGIPLCFAGTAIAGFSSSFFEIGWRAVLYRCNEENIDANIAITSVFSRLIIIVFVVCSSVVSFIVLVAVVFGSPLLMMRCTKLLRCKVPSRKIGAKSMAGMSPVIWSALVVAAFWFAYCALENMTIPSRMTNYTVLSFAMAAGCLLSFVIAMAFSLFRRSVSFATVIRDSVLCLSAVLLVAAWVIPQGSVLVYAAASSVQLALSILLWISGISFMQESGQSFARIQSTIRLFLYIGVVSATLAWPTVKQLDATSTLLVLAVVLLGVTVFALGRMVDADHLRTSRQFRNASHRLHDASDATETTRLSRNIDRSGSADAGDDSEKLRTSRVRSVAERYGLSPREEEVFALLVNGRDSVYIRNTLYISKNTVGTHIKSIYRKMSVHSKQELIDVFEGRAPKD